MEPKIRHLAPASRSPRIAAGHFESKVFIWDLRSRSSSPGFDTVLSFGGSRLALTPAGDICIAAGYESGGVVGYDALDGSVTWQRPDLRKCQTVISSRDGMNVFCCFDDRPMEVLDPKTGATLERVKAVRGIHESRFDNSRLLETTALSIGGQWGTHTIKRTTFAVLDAAFGPGMVAVSESGGPVRCLDLHGKDIWTYVPPAGIHVLKLDWSSTAEHFVGIQWPYQKGGPKALVLLGKNSRKIADLGSVPEFAFAEDGDILVTSTGRLLSVTDPLHFEQIALHDEAA